MVKKRRKTPAKKKKKQISVSERVTNIRNFFTNLNLEEIKNYKMITMVLLVADLFGIYWYFELKKLGIALMLICMGLLSVFLILERRYPEKMSEEEEKKPDKKEEEEEEEKVEDKKDKKDDDEEEEEGVSMFDFGGLGLPDAEKYQENLRKAVEM